MRHPLRCPAMGAISGHIQDPAAGIVLSRETGDVPTVHPGAAQIDVGVLQVGKSLRVRPGIGAANLRQEHDPGRRETIRHVHSIRTLNSGASADVKPASRRVADCLSPIVIRRYNEANSRDLADQLFCYPGFG